MGQFSTSTLLVLLCVGVTLSVAISDFDLLLEHVDLLKLKIIHLQSGKLALFVAVMGSSVIAQTTSQ